MPENLTISTTPTPLPLFPPDQTFHQAVHSADEQLKVYFHQLDSEDEDVKEARRILGILADQLSSDELKEIVTEVKYLTTCWLDEYERSIFKGKTVAEILHEKGAYVKRR